MRQPRVIGGDIVVVHREGNIDTIFDWFILGSTTCIINLAVAIGFTVAGTTPKSSLRYGQKTHGIENTRNYEEFISFPHDAWI
jgi:hypothetical protein